MEICNERVTVACVDDVAVIGETKEEVINTTSKLTYARKKIGLHVNDGKTKCLVVSRRPPNIDSVEVEQIV